MLTLVRLGPVGSSVLIFLTAAFSLAILAYDPSIINNLNINAVYVEHFQLDHTYIGLNAAVISAGAVFGGLFAGPITDRWGRKAALGVGNLVILLGVILQASAPSEPQFIVGRFFIGVATVINGSVAPMWVAELGSPKYRVLLSGLVMCSVPFAAVIGCLVILGVWNSSSNWGWRGAILGEAVAAVIALGLLSFVDESPRWLISKQRHKEALEILIRLHVDGDSEDRHALAQAEYKEIFNTLEYERQHEGSWKSLVSPATNLRRFGLATLTSIFYQIIGANMILYFLSLMIMAAGITDVNKTLHISLGVMIWNFGTSIMGAFTINYFGRRTSLIFGTSTLIVCFAIMSGLVHLSESTGDTRYGIGAIVVIAIATVGSNFSWLLLAYIYPSEVLKFSQRGKGVATSQSIGFLFSFLNLYTSPLALERISYKYYAINAGWNVAILLLIIWLFVETQGKTLEEIDEIFEGATHTSGQYTGTGENFHVIDGEALSRNDTGATRVGESRSQVKGEPKVNMDETSALIGSD